MARVRPVRPVNTKDLLARVDMLDDLNDRAVDRLAADLKDGFDVLTASGDAHDLLLGPVEKLVEAHEKVAKRQRKNRTTVATPAETTMTITASGGIPGVTPGSPVDMDAVSVAMTEVLRSQQGARPDGKVRTRVAQLTVSMDESKRAQEGEEGRDNDALLEAVVNEHNALVAAGVCGPVSPLFGQLTVGDASRPIASALPSAPSERGGIRFSPPPTLSDIVVEGPGGAVGLHTNADDVSGTPKTVQVIECGDEEEVFVEAVYESLEFSNASGRFFPERVQAHVDLTRVAHARLAEQRMLTAIDAASTLVNVDRVVGATRNTLHGVLQAVAGIRSRNRMPETTLLTAILPDWAYQLFAADIGMQHPGDGLESLQYGESQVGEMLRTAGVQPVFSPDATVFGGQVPGGLLDFPDDLDIRIFVPGVFAHLDAGTLDLGTVRDSVMNTANRYRLFAESWEATVHLGGPEALLLNVEVCSDGSAAADISTEGICSGASLGS